MKAVELKGDDDATLLELSKELRLVEESQAIGRQADTNDLLPGEGFVDQVEEVRVKEGFATGKIDDIDLALGLKGPVENVTEFLKGQIPRMK
jgi:hypothetical protein